MARALLLLAVAACTTYRGTAHDTSPGKLAREPGWLLLRDVSYAAQQHETECGAAAIAMVVGYWTGKAPDAIVAALRPVPKDGLAAARLRDYARQEGLASFVIAGELADLVRELSAGRPVIVGLSKPQTRDRVLDHYEVVVGLHRERKLIVTLDPQEGWRENSIAAFYREWKLADFTTLVVSAPAGRAARSP